MTNSTAMGMEKLGYDLSPRPVLSSPLKPEAVAEARRRYRISLFQSQI